MKNSLLVFGTKNFNNTLNEVKEYLEFSLIFFKDNTLFADKIYSINAVLIDSDVCNNSDILSVINSIVNKPILLIDHKGSFKKCNYTDKITSPLILSDFNSIILTLVSSKEFNKNSSIKIKQYTIDKNEKKLKRDDVSITVTEKEIQLMKLLFEEKKPLSKNNLLKILWKYSEEADTHTVETHIYRLRKKISDKFNDEHFIVHSKNGYSI